MAHQFGTHTHIGNHHIEVWLSAGNWQWEVTVVNTGQVIATGVSHDMERAKTRALHILGDPQAAWQSLAMKKPPSSRAEGA